MLLSLWWERQDAICLVPWKGYPSIPLATGILAMSLKWQILVSSQGLSPTLWSACVSTSHSFLVLPDHPVVTEVIGQCDQVYYSAELVAVYFQDSSYCCRGQTVELNKDIIRTTTAAPFRCLMVAPSLLG